MNKAEKQRQIEAGERCRCLVPFCNRTSKLDDEEIRLAKEQGVNWQWLCGPHWRNTRKLYRRAHRKYQKKYAAKDFPGRVTPFWKRIVEEAIAKGGLNDGG